MRKVLIVLVLYLFSLPCKAQEPFGLLELEIDSEKLNFKVESWPGVPPPEGAEFQMFQVINGGALMPLAPSVPFFGKDSPEGKRFYAKPFSILIPSLPGTSTILRPGVRWSTNIFYGEPCSFVLPQLSLPPSENLCMKNKTFTIFSTEPRLKIVNPLQDQIATNGSNVTFSVEVQSFFPVLYEWRFENDKLPNANSSILVIPSVTKAQEGTYSVSIYQLGGQTVTLTAKLSVREENVIQPPMVTLQILPVITLAGQTNHNYRIEWSPIANATNWLYLGTFKLDHSPQMFADTTAINGSTNRYYRAVLVE